MAESGRVLVTRASQQGSALADRLRAFGLEPVLVPAIAIAAPSDAGALEEALRDVGSFDWLVVSSANAVPPLTERLQGHALPQCVRVAAIGAATAQALAEAGFRVDLVPPQAVAESFAAALLPFAHRTDGTPSRLLLLRAEEGRDLMPDRLRAAGATVVLAAAYRTVVPESSVALLRQLCADPVDLRAITFTSSSTVRNLLGLFEAAGMDVPTTALRVSIGPITSATLRELGLPAHAEAPEATVEALARTVAEAIAAHASSAAGEAG